MDLAALLEPIMAFFKDGIGKTILDALMKLYELLYPANSDPAKPIENHSNHGSHYVSVVYNEQLSQHGISVCLGTVGDSYKYNKALAEKRSRFLQKRAQLIPERKATLSRWKSPR